MTQHIYFFYGATALLQPLMVELRILCAVYQREKKFAYVLAPGLCPPSLIGCEATPLVTKFASMS